MEINPNIPAGKIADKSKNSNSVWEVLIKLQNISQALHPKISAKYSGWCSYHRTNVPVEDYVRILRMNNTSDIIKFLIKKI